MGAVLCEVSRVCQCSFQMHVNERFGNVTLIIRWKFNSQLMLPLAHSRLRDFSAWKEYELLHSLNSNETLPFSLHPPLAYTFKNYQSKEEGEDVRSSAPQVAG